MIELEVLQVFYDIKTDKMYDVGQTISVTKERYEEMKVNFGEFGGHEHYISVLKEELDKPKTTKRTKKEAPPEE